MSAAVLNRSKYVVFIACLELVKADQIRLSLVVLYLLNQILLNKLELKT